MVSSHVVALSVLVSLKAQLIPVSRFPSFPYAPALCRDLQTQANIFCIIRTSFNRKEWLLCSLYSYLFFFKRSPYIIIHLARHAERREEACWCQSYFPAWIIHSFVWFWFWFRFRFLISAFPHARLLGIVYILERRFSKLLWIRDN